MGKKSTRPIHLSKSPPSFSSSPPKRNGPSRHPGTRRPAHRGWYSPNSSRRPDRGSPNDYGSARRSGGAIHGEPVCWRHPALIAGPSTAPDQSNPPRPLPSARLKTASLRDARVNGHRFGRAGHFSFRAAAVKRPLPLPQIIFTTEARSGFAADCQRGNLPACWRNDSVYICRLPCQSGMSVGRGRGFCGVSRGACVGFRGCGGNTDKPTRYDDAQPRPPHRERPAP